MARVWEHRDEILAIKLVVEGSVARRGEVKGRRMKRGDSGGRVRGEGWGNGMRAAARDNSPKEREREN